MPEVLDAVLTAPQSGHHGQLPSDDETVWQPIILNLQQSGDEARLRDLLAQGVVFRVYDNITAQLSDLAATRMPRQRHDPAAVAAGVRAILADAPITRYGRWVLYPWSGRLVHVLPPAEFRELRLDRNRNKITVAEQQRLQQLTVAVVGLSVGNAVALTLALEATCGCLKLADFDRLDVSNMNRIRAGVHDIGLPKTTLAARQIFEFDPYARVQLYPAGVRENDLDAFLLDAPRVDVLVDECDSLDVKVRLREAARRHRIPVLMETSDRGMLDVERFDVEPDRPILHGLAGELDAQRLAGLSTEEKVPIVLRIIGAQTMSTRMGASLVEVDRTICTWPQLGADVTLGGATVAAAVRRIGLGEPLTSGRRYVDLDQLLGAPVAVTSVSARERAAPAPREHSDATIAALPTLVRHALEHAVRAPSGGNCQPWRFHVDDGSIWLVHDRARSRNLLDVGQRASWLAMGAALENIALTAAAAGERAVMAAFPKPAQLQLAAHVRLEPQPQRDPEPAIRLYEQITRRATNRQLATRVSLEAAEIRALLACSTPTAALQLVTDAAALDEVGSILGSADRVRFLCPELHAEMMSELRWNHDEAQRTGDGIDIASLELPEKDEAAIRLLARPDIVARLRQQRGGVALEESAQKAVAAASAVGVLWIPHDVPHDWLHGGRVLQRSWLCATALGLTVHPMTAVLYMLRMCATDAGRVFDAVERSTLEQLAARLGSVLGQPVLTNPPAMLFRIARAPEPSTRALRRPLADVVAMGAPDIIHG